MTHLPYKGSELATAALIGGEVTAVFEGLDSAPYIRRGKARVLAVFRAERWPAFPDIPMAAQGGLPDFESPSWSGLWAPAGTNAAVTGRMQAAIATAFASADLKKIWDGQGAAPGGAPTAHFAAFVAEAIGKRARSFATETSRSKEVAATGEE